MALLLSPALAVTPHAHSRQARPAGHPPARGIFVPGTSLAGVELGDTMTRVRTVFGTGDTSCTTKNSPPCSEAVWLFEYTRGEPLGVATTFHNGKVSAVVTLGAIDGWRTAEGLKIGGPVSSMYDTYPPTTNTKCIRFETLSMKKGTATSSIHTASGVEYGFALTAPTEAVCQ